MYSFTVLMSTFNGEKYLKDQIDSILDQKGVSVDLFVRDDSSTDATLDILRKYESENLSIHVSHGDNIGPALSFMKLLYDSPTTTDYYAFADQDDIWLPNKLKTAAIMLEKNETALLYASNQTIIDSKANILGKRYKESPPVDLFNIIDKNYLAGCTMVFDKKLAEILKDNRANENILKSRMHDTWIAAVADCFGNIIYDEQSYILYRQHGNNVVGIKKSSILNRAISKVRQNKLHAKDYHITFADELNEVFKGKVNIEAREIINLYQNMNTFTGKIKLLKSRYFTKNYYRNKMSFAIKLFL